jgi:hypothetical protein
MQQRISWEASSSLASQKIPRVLLDPEVQNRGHKSPQLVPNLSQSSPRPSSVILLLKIHSNIILPRYVHPCQHEERRALWLFIYEDQLRIFWISNSRQATRSGPPIWGLGDVMTIVHRCTMLWNWKDSLRPGQMLRNRQQALYLKRHIIDTVCISVTSCCQLQKKATFVFRFLTIKLSSIAQLQKMRLPPLRSVHVFVRSLYKIFCTCKFRT